MKESRFTKWIRWGERDYLNGKRFPDVYCIAISEYDLSNKKFNWTPEIKYIGMTNSITKQNQKNIL